MLKNSNQDTLKNIKVHIELYAAVDSWHAQAQPLQDVTQEGDARTVLYAGGVPWHAHAHSLQDVTKEFRVLTQEHQATVANIICKKEEAQTKNRLA